MTVRRPLIYAVAAALATLALLLAGLMAGSDGWAWPGGELAEQQLIVWQIRAPRSLGAWLVGALLGLGGALAQGLFRNPLAEPYLLGAAPGATLAVVLVLAGSAGLGAIGLGGLAESLVSSLASGLASTPTSQASWLASSMALLAAWLPGLGLVLAAFVGALVGVFTTLTLARGATHTSTLLLAGIVVGFLLGALADLVTLTVPDALRGKQAFLLGNTGFLGWDACAALGAGLALTLAAAWPLARGLDALALGDDSAASLGLPVQRLRLVLVITLALATAVAVAQAGLVSFVGLVAPHLARRNVGARHALLVPASALAGGALLLAADLLARTIVAPQEWPVGVLTAVLGGIYLLVLLHRKRP